MKGADMLLGGQAFLVREFMDPPECEEHIDQSEDLGYEDAPIDAGGAPVFVRDYRSNSRVILDDPELAARPFLRLRDYLPPRMDDRSLSGLNERFRYYRYDSGESFAPHFDAHFDAATTRRAPLRSWCT